MRHKHLVWPGGAQAAISITFDDGYSDTVENTYRWLSERHLSATYFIITGKVGASFEGRSTASWSMLRQADRRGHEIGCHGASHTPLGGIRSDFRRLAQGLLTSPDRVGFLWQTSYRGIQVYSRPYSTIQTRLDPVQETLAAKIEIE